MKPAVRSNVTQSGVEGSRVPQHDRCIDQRALNVILSGGEARDEGWLVEQHQHRGDRTFDSAFGSAQCDVYVQALGSRAVRFFCHPLIVVLALSGSYAFAQDDLDAGTQITSPLPELTTVITSGRLPQQLKDSTVAVEVITRRQIQESGARDLAEALQSRPGIETFQNVGTTGIRMGGLGPEYNLIMVDGQRIAGRINGGIDVSRISVENIEQIEIVKGPSSVLWGSEALAGTINIITRAPSRPLSGSATASYGTLNQISATGSGEATRGLYGLQVSGGYEHRDAYDYDPNTVATSGSSLDQGQAAIRGTWGGRSADAPKADLRLDFTRRVQHGIDQGAGSVIFDRASRDNIAQGRLGGHLPLGNGSVDLSASGSFYDRRFILDQRDASALDDVQDSREAVAQLDAQVSQTYFDTHTLLGGGQVLLETLSSPRLDGGSGVRFRGALFAQDGWAPDISHPFTIAAGVRADFDSFFGAAFTPRLSLRFDPISTIAIRASTGLGFRAPTFQELLLDFENPSVGYVILGNPALRPEHSWGSSAGVQWNPARFLFSLNLFWNELWDMIGYVSSSGVGELRYQYANISRGRSRGGEVSAGVTPWDPLSLEVGYTLTDTRDFSTGLPLEGQAAHRGYGQIRLRLRQWGLTALVRCAVTGPRPLLNDDGASVRYTKAFAMLDARIAKTLGRFVEVFVSGMNLLGAGNAVDLPSPPRSVFAGVTVHD